jgi:hypothetical protein
MKDTCLHKSIPLQLCSTLTFNNSIILLLHAHGYLWEAADQCSWTVPVYVKAKPKLSSWVLFGLGVYWNRAVLFQIWVCLVQNWIEWSDSWKSIFGSHPASHHFEKNYRTWALVSRDCKCVENRPIFMNVDKTGLVRFCRFYQNSTGLILNFQKNRKFEIKICKRTRAREMNLGESGSQKICS